MTMRSNELTRRSLLVFAGLAGLASMSRVKSVRAEAVPTVDVVRNPSCGCCGRWIEHLRDNGFVVNVAESTDMQSIKRSAGVPPELASCHTAHTSGYVIEGHVPASAIQWLLAERPKARGLAVPGMPIGSPGMEATAAVAYDVILFGIATQKIYGRYKGLHPL